MFHYNLSTLPVSFYFFFPNEKANTQTKKKPGILFPYMVPFSMKIDGGDEKLFMGSLPRLLHECFLPVPADSQGCAWTGHISLVCVGFSAGKAPSLMSFPATRTLRLNICIKQIAFVLQLLVTLLPYFSSICWSAVCLWKTGYKVGFIDHILCILIFYLLFGLL